MNVMFARFVRLALGLLATVLTSRAQTTFLGILEDVPGVYAGESHVRAVRVVFEKNSRDWKALPSDCRD